MFFIQWSFNYMNTENVKIPVSYNRIFCSKLLNLANGNENGITDSVCMFTVHNLFKAWTAP